MGRKKSWREKLERVVQPKIVDDPKGRGKMLVATPLIVDSLIRKIPRGKLATVSQIRDKLARDFNADFACPLATGWFIRISAEAAEEDLREGRKRFEEITPWWRVVKNDGSLNEKFPGGARLQAERLLQEGFSIVSRRGKLRVEGFEKYLVDW